MDLYEYSINQWDRFEEEYHDRDWSGEDATYEDEYDIDDRKEGE